MFYLLTLLLLIKPLNCQIKNENFNIVKGIDELANEKEIPLASKNVLEEILNTMKYDFDDGKNAIKLSYSGNKIKTGILRLKILFLNYFLNLTKNIINLK